jgi:diguanylate cyclase (GGDEF)-like protein
MGLNAGHEPVDLSRMRHPGDGTVAGAADAVRPLSGPPIGESGDRGVETAVGTVALLSLILVPVQIALLQGDAQTVVVATFVASGVLLAAAWSWLRRHGPVDQQAACPRVIAVLLGVPAILVADSLVILGASGEIDRTTTLMLVVVGVSAAVAVRWVVAVVLSVAVIGWFGTVMPLVDATPAAEAHYAVQLLLAVVLGSILSMLRMRSEEQINRARQQAVDEAARLREAQDALRDSELNLAAVARVSRRIQSGDDVRTEIVSSAVEIAHATVAALVEPRDGVLTVTRSSDRSLEGATIASGETSATLEVFRTGEPIYAFDAVSHPLVSQRLRELSGAVSMVWEPVMRRGSVEGVLVVTWSQPVTSLSERSVQVIRLLADECSVGLEGETLRDELAALAHTDPLTGLLNRRGWDERVQHLAGLARRERLPLTLGIIDLDHFKVYNDEYGHAAGDDLLAGFARAARGILRDVDVIARWGGEEFVVALPGCTAETAQAVLARLCFAVPNGQTCSVGQYTWDGYGSIEAAIARADRALYSAKSDGRARVAVAV